MLAESGYDSFDALFAGIPEEVRIKELSDVPEGMSELETAQAVSAMAEENVTYRAIFRGAGAYDHYIPSIVRRVTHKERFLTAYTPYQAEISQGVLQSIFEYQSMITALTGMAVSNASVYDGAAAAAEGAMMCLEKKRHTVLISETLAPQVRSVVETYSRGRGVPCRTVPMKGGKTDPEALREMLADDTACFIAAQPNYFGIIEDLKALGEAVHAAGAKFVVSCNPVSLGILKTPAELGADVAVGEGQPLGMPLAFGGPYLGFMAATEKMMRRLPGRIVGETTDAEGRRAFVLTLQAREQHIKRERAGSNICSNEALCALTAAVYLSAMGADGLAEAARQCAAKAHYLQNGLSEAGFKPAYREPFFHEFVTVSPGKNEEEAERNTAALLIALGEEGILGGLPLGGGRILWCATEKNTKEDMDEIIRTAKEVRAK